MMPDAETLMRQAWYTAEVWMDAGKKYVDLVYPDAPASVKATLVAAYVNAAGLDQAAMYLRSLHDGLYEAAERLAENETWAGPNN